MSDAALGAALRDPGYAAGVAVAEHVIAALDTPVAGQAPDSGHSGVTPMGSAEWAASKLAEELMAQSDAKDTLRRKEQPGAEEYDSAAAEKRGRWLQVAAMNAPAERLGRAEGTVIQLPHGALALATLAGDGSIERLAPVVLGVEDIAPADWDRRNAVWEARQRVNENELLARSFGADQCVAEGLFSEAERSELDPGRSKHTPLPRGLEGM
jgi:hypothetical protein